MTRSLNHSILPDGLRDFFRLINASSADFFADGGDLSGAVSVAVAIGMAIPVAVAIAVPGRLRNGGADGDELGSGLLQHQLLVELPRLLGFPSQLAPPLLLFRCGHWNVVLALADADGVILVDLQRVLVASQVDVLALGVNLVLAVGLVPLGDRGVLVHVLDDVPPPDARVVSAERNLALLRRK